jgi:hypothetical protein
MDDPVRALDPLEHERREGLSASHRVIAAKKIVGERNEPHFLIETQLRSSSS